MIYLAAVDETLFNFILSKSVQNQLTVSLATTVAAALPMFFAVGMIRESISINWFTIYQYERMIERKAFWLIAIIVLIIVAILHLTNIIPVLIAGVDLNIQAIGTVAGCIISAIYLAIYTSKL